MFYATIWLILTYQTTVQSHSHSHLKTDLVYPKPTCRSHPKHSEIAISTVLRRPPFHWLTMNLIQVKFNLERTSSCKWKVMKQYGNKAGKPCLQPRLLWQAGIEQGDSEDTGQSVIWTKPEWEHAKQARCGKCRNTKSKLTNDLIFREIRLFKEKLGFVKKWLVLLRSEKLAWVNFSGFLYAFFR